MAINTINGITDTNIIRVNFSADSNIIHDGDCRSENVISYLLYDTFATKLAAGTVNGTYAEFTGGLRAVTDTGGNLSIGGSSYTFIDTYAPTLAAGAVNGTLADLGHVRTVTDTESKLSLT